jgi:hypothetical protein
MPRWLRLGAYAVATLAALWTAGWFVVAYAIESGIRGWAADMTARGTRVDVGAIDIDGFPLRWRVITTDYAIARDGAPPESLRGARLEATLEPWEPSRVALRLPGRHRFERGGGEPVILDIQAARPDGALRLGAEGRLRALDLDLGQVEIRPADGGAATTIGRLRLAVSQTRPADPRTREWLTLALDAEELVPPRVATAPLDPTIRRARAELTLRGEVDGAGGPAERVAAWRDSGGVLELAALELDWAPLRLRGDGTATLDARNRPQAALTLRVAGLPELVDALARARRIAPAQAIALKALAAGLARGDAAGGRAEVTLPITAQDGRLSIAGFPVMRLAPIQFPAR